MRNAERMVLPQPPPLMVERRVVTDQRHNLDAGRLGLEHEMVPIVLYGQVIDTSHQLGDVNPLLDMGTV